MKKEKSKRKPTLKEKAVADAIISGKSATEGAVEGYNVSTRESARSIAHDVLQRPAVQDYIAQEIASIKGNAIQSMGTGLSDAIAGAKQDLLNEDARVKAQARKFLLDCAKYLEEKNDSGDKGPRKHLFPQRS